MAPSHNYHPQAEAFQERYVPVPESGCWLWIGSSDQRGYGRIWIARGKHVKAHRASYEMHVGAIPDGMSVCHKCDTPSCVNPSHLYAGTHLENMRDMSLRGRRCRERTSCKLSAADIREIKVALINGTESQTALARRFGVSQSNISKIHCGEAWREVLV